MNPFLAVLLLFATLGIFVARVFFTRLGIDPDYLFVGLGALVVSLLLMYRGSLLLLLVAIMTVGVNLPDQFLVDYGVDRDILLSALMTIIIFPFIHKAVSD